MPLGQEPETLCLEPQAERFPFQPVRTRIDPRYGNVWMHAKGNPARLSPCQAVFDGDRAGREAARKVADLFVAQGLPAPRIVPLPDGQDVTDYFTHQRSKIRV